MNIPEIDYIGDCHISTSVETPLLANAFEKSNDEKIKNIEHYFAQIMTELGLDLSDDSLSGTPHRIAKMYVNEILSGLWIGDSAILNSQKFMKENSIDIILNCTQIFDFPDLDIQKVRLPFSNDKNSDTDLMLLRQNKDKILSFIDDNISDKNILIVCYDGKSISPFLVSLYIAEYSKIDKKSIYNILLTKDSSLSLWFDLSLFYNM